MNTSILAAVALLFFSACGNDDPSSGELAENPRMGKSEGLLETENESVGTRMEGVRFSYSERGEILHVIHAGVLLRTEAEDENDVIHVSNGFTMYIEGDESMHEARLSAGRGKLDETAMRLVAEDDVVLENTNGDRLETEYLVWAHDSDRVHTDRPVAIYTSKGVIFGKGLESDARFESYRILQPTGEIPIDLSSR